MRAVFLCREELIQALAPRAAPCALKLSGCLRLETSAVFATAAVAWPGLQHLAVVEGDGVGQVSEAALGTMLAGLGRQLVGLEVGEELSDTMLQSEVAWPAVSFCTGLRKLRLEVSDTVHPGEHKRRMPHKAVGPKLL